MFELADRLVGIYKTNDTTKSVTINPKSFQQNASVAAPSNENTTTAASGEMKGRTNGLANHQQKEQQSLPLGDATNRYLK
jgi:structural maintenance of chromosome 4